ncbi:MAG TPA: tetratricopeptide repeat protein [Mucilaginibacter sp.]|jgi:tetratricopeptide (TPR) repeat protein
MRFFLRFLCLLILVCYTVNVFGQAVTTVHKPAPVDSATRVTQLQKNIEDVTLAIKQKKSSNPTALSVLYIMRAMDESALQQYDTAIQDFSTAIEINADLKVAYWNRGLAYERVKNYDGALSDYQKALTYYKNDPSQAVILYNNIAIIQKDLRKFDEAIASDSIAIALEPRYPPAYVNRAKVYMITRKYENAIKDFNIALNANYSKQVLSNLLFGRGDAKRFLRRYKEAINDYSLAIELNPDNRLAYWNRAASYNQNGDFELANTDYSKAITYYKGDSKNLARLYDDRALMEIDIQQYQKAIADDSLAITLDDKLALAYWHSADAYAENGDFQLSIDWYYKAMPFYQTNKSAQGFFYDNIASEAYFLNDYQKVIDASTSSITLYGKAWGPHLNRGRAYLKKANKEMAMNDFNKVLVLDTTKASFEYAFALFYTGNSDKAIEVMQKNVIATTNDAVLRSHYYNLACLFSLMNKPDEANIYLKKCIDSGYSKKYVQTDPDLDNIRNTKEYIDIMH